MKILCVCTGNTCRSPMLAVLLRSELQRRAKSGTVESAGTGATPGDVASEGAVTAMGRRGLALDNHRSRAVLGLDLASFDRVLCMSSGHAAYVRSLGVPAARLAVVNAEGGGIPDPYGRDDEAYEECAQALQSFAEDWIEDLPADPPPPGG